MSFDLLEDEGEYMPGVFSEDEALPYFEEKSEDSEERNISYNDEFSDLSPGQSPSELTLSERELRQRLIQITDPVEVKNLSPFERKLRRMEMNRISAKKNREKRK